MEYAANPAICTDCKEATGLHRAPRAAGRKRKDCRYPRCFHEADRPQRAAAAFSPSALTTCLHYLPPTAICQTSVTVPRCCSLDHGLLVCFSRRYADCCRFHCSPICPAIAFTTVHARTPCTTCHALVVFSLRDSSPAHPSGLMDPGHVPGPVRSITLVALAVVARVAPPGDARLLAAPAT